MKIRLIKQDWLEEPYVLEYYYSSDYNCAVRFYWLEIRRFQALPAAQRAFEALQKGRELIAEGECPNDAL